LFLCERQALARKQKVVEERSVDCTHIYCGPSEHHLTTNCFDGDLL
jgi:hypothetical protein